MAMITPTVNSRYEPPSAAPTKATTPIVPTSRRPARIDSSCEASGSRGLLIRSISTSVIWLRPTM